ASLFWFILTNEEKKLVNNLILKIKKKL
ncbi:MAG: hypothetical protein ACI93N_000326, partial [Flavobacteriaceae bacterium]